jgi:hypothetical protein
MVGELLVGVRRHIDDDSVSRDDVHKVGSRYLTSLIAIAQRAKTSLTLPPSFV